METSFVIIIMNLLLCLFSYFREREFGVASIYVFGMIIMYFIPIIYNVLLIPNFFLNPEVQAAWLGGSLLVLFQKYPLRQLDKFVERTIPQKRIVQNILLVGVVLLGIAIAGVAGFGHIMRFPTIGVYTWACLFALYSYKHREKLGSLWLLLVMEAIAASLIFFTLLWSGFGRLILGQFIIIGFFFLSRVLIRVWFPKLLLLLMLPVFIMVGGVLRSSKATLASALASGEGVGSMMEPLAYNEFLFMDMSRKRFEKLNGESYVATFLFWVPRAIWTGKPVGFGRQMVLWYVPRNRHPGYTLAGTHLGEAFGNFGVAGLFFGPFLLFMLVGVLIRNVLGGAGNNNLPNSTMRILLGVLFVATIPDFLWGGSFTSFSRSGLAVLFSFPAIFILSKVRLF